MKVIFLDFDGTICNATSYGGHRSGLNAVAAPECVTEVNRITNRTGAKIVVSSTWRLYMDAAAIKAKLKSWGIAGEFIGITPQHAGWDTNRGTEIAAWLAEHPDTEKFVILDDDADMGDLRPYLIQTVFREGLLTSHADKAILALL